jgi:uncharacterized membrane protein YidH (DUF202 family)
MQIIRLTGLALVGAGILLLMGFAFNSLVTAFDVPPMIKVAISILVVGFLVLLASLAHERWKEVRKR